MEVGTGYTSAYPGSCSWPAAAAVAAVHTVVLGDMELGQVDVAAGAVVDVAVGVVAGVAVDVTVEIEKVGEEGQAGQTVASGIEAAASRLLRRRGTNRVVEMWQSSRDYTALGIGALGIAHPMGGGVDRMIAHR